jgi:protein-L-isoaspartate(D-aspartate) O-methyltransferase
MNTSTARINMIKQQLRTGDILNPKTLSLYNQIPRQTFVPLEFQNFAYTDMQIELPHGQRMMTPLEEATLLQALNLEGNEVVLEIGTGTGFLTACLSDLCKKVISIDIHADFTKAARKKLTDPKYKNIELHTGDGSLGWVNDAPYDVIIFTGAMPMIKETHRLQVNLGGKLFAIIGEDPIMQGQLHQLDADGNWHQSLLFETQLPYLDHTQTKDHFIF